MKVIGGMNCVENMEQETTGIKINPSPKRNKEYANGSDSALKARQNYLEKIKWKEYEDEIIKNNYKNYSDKQIKEKFLPHRTTTSVMRRRYALRFLKLKPKHQIWTDEELSLLYLHWKDYDQKELKEKFFPNKTVQQVKNAKMHRNLKKPPVWTNEERGLLIDHGPNYNRSELQEIFFPNKTKDQISWMKKHLGVKRNLNSRN